MAGRRWTEEEQAYLREHLGTDSIHSISRKLNRTEDAVICKIYDLRIAHLIDTSDKAYCNRNRKIAATQRAKYRARKDEALCVKCGRRWAQAGETMCRPCREKTRQACIDNSTKEYIAAYKARQRAERRLHNLCTYCGKPLSAEEIGVNTQCRTCRKKAMERTTVKRIEMRMRGIKRTS